MSERTAVETIQAAIEKLEQQRDDATLAPWTVDEIPETGECRIIREFEFFGAQYEAVTGGGSQRADAQLIVTLHRTIDAQLAILKFAADGLYDLPEFVALAAAILGKES